MSVFWSGVLVWVGMVIVVEAVVEIVVEGEIFFGLRNYLSKKNPRFLGKLLGCGYCFSVWAAAVAWLLPGDFCIAVDLGQPYELVINIILKTFLLHRLSNIVHGFITRVVTRMPFEVVVTHVQHDETTIMTGENWKAGNENE